MIFRSSAQYTSKAAGANSRLLLRNVFARAQPASSAMAPSAAWGNPIPLFFPIPPYFPNFSFPRPYTDAYACVAQPFRFRRQKLLARLAGRRARLSGRSMPSLVHFASCTSELDDQQTEVLARLLKYGPSVRG